MNIQPTVQLSTVDYRAELQSAATKAPALLNEIRSLVVDTPDDLTLANHLIHAVAAKAKERAAQLKRAMDPLTALEKEIRSWFKPELDFLKEARALLEPKIGGYLQRQEQARQEALRLAQQAHEAGNHEATALALNEASTADTAAPAGTSLCYTWKAQVRNPTIVPYEYLSPDLDKIQAHASAFPGDGPPPTPIAGVEYVKDLDMRIRTAPPRGQR